ncbi:MAG TPA: FAD-linked oxidase C-terminal domain-containing protein, partial [Bacillota bacterium]
EVRSDPVQQRQIWNMRKAAVPLLYRMPGDPKPVPFIEDMAVSPAVLPAYVRGLQELFARHGVKSVIYAHASVGCLHLRPVLNLKEPDEVEKMARIAREACELVASLGGVMSGEHGDGLSRTQWNRLLYGDRLWEAFGRVKRAFDPAGLLNPGKVYADDVDLRRHQRYGDGYQTRPWTAALDFSDQGSFPQAVELCNGCGHCRKSTGTMCPTFRALDEEIMTTRGRANLIRGALSGRLGEDVLFSPEFRRQVLDYCIGCKGCRVECPSGVDLARIKAELLYHYHQRHGKPLRSLMLGHIRLLNRLGSAAAPLSNALAQAAPLRVLAEYVLGLDRRRPLPRFASPTLSARLRRAGLDTPPPDGVVGDHRERAEQRRRRVLIFPDCFVEYNEPELGLAAVRVLERAGCEVRLAPAVACCGRPAISEGLLDEARTFARRNRDALLPYVEAGWDIVTLEPSCTASFRHELRELLGFGDAGARQLAEHVFDVTEYLGRLLDAGELEALRHTRSAVTPDAAVPAKLTYHGHCHQKSLLAHLPTARVLKALTGATVDVIDAGCCGMAGSFGYKRENYDFSVRIAEPVRQAVVASGGMLVASGTSCRAQFSDLYGWRALHPIEVLDRATAAFPARPAAHS